MLLLVLLAVVLPAVASWLVLRLLLPSLRLGLLDQPNARSSHCQPTPSGGGVSFVAVSLIASALSLLLGSNPAPAYLPLVAAPFLLLPLAIIGFLDDRYHLPATWRYGVQIVTSLALILLSPLVPPSLALQALLLIAVTAVINFTNFMDGLDGLVAGCMAVALTTAAVQLMAPWSIWALVGGLLGFIVWNWSPAKVFMGDVGSTFLGAIYTFLLLQASNWSDALSLLLVSTPLLADALICVPRRLMAGQQVFQAHRLHLFQRLHQAGWSHSRVSTLYITATSLLAIALLLGGLPWVIAVASLELLFGVWLDQRVAVPFAFVSPS